VVPALIAGYRGALRLIAGVWDNFVRVVRKPKVREIFSTFCAEVAVLVAVFPILDSIIGNRQTPSGIQNVTWSLGLSSAIIVIVFLLAAIAIVDKGDQ